MESLDMPQIYRELGKAIKRQRKIRKLTQETLADRVGITPQYLSRIECGVVRPTLDLIYEISRVLECSVYVLLPSSLEPQRGFLSEDISYRMNHCTEHQKMLLLSFASWVLSQ